MSEESSRVVCGIVGNREVRASTRKVASNLRIHCFILQFVQSSKRESQMKIW